VAKPALSLPLAPAEPPMSANAVPSSWNTCSSIIAAQASARSTALSSLAFPAPAHQLPKLPFSADAER
jgi:hypothetical protein